MTSYIKLGIPLL